MGSLNPACESRSRRQPLAEGAAALRQAPLHKTSGNSHSRAALAPLPPLPLLVDVLVLAVVLVEVLPSPPAEVFVVIPAVVEVSLLVAPLESGIVPS